jgi:hypothetical protein
MNDEVVMIEVTATGHYSNASATHTCWVTKDFVEKYKDDIASYSTSFDELDGKNSETEAEINILSDHRDMALAYADALGDSWKITEDMFESFDLSDDEIHEMSNFNDDMNNMVSVETRTIIRIGDVEVEV